MVLRNARRNKILDNSNRPGKRSSTVSDRHALSAILQFPSGVCQESGAIYQTLCIQTTQWNADANNDEQYWRLLTTFLYFGPLSLDLVFHVFFLQRYSRLLEESSGRSPAHFSWLILYSTTCLILLSPLVNMPFLGHPLSSTLVYIWSRRNPDTQLSFLGLMVFSAPWLPWVLMAFSLVVHGNVPKDEIMGVVIGHVWYFFSDVYPPLHGGSRPFDPPMWWRRIFEGRRAEVRRQETVDAINHDIAVAAAPEVR